MKINKEQFNNLPQLDRIEIRQRIIYLHLATGICWIVTFVLFSHSPLAATIMLIYTLWRALKFDKDYIEKLEQEYFEVKRSTREVKNK